NIPYPHWFIPFCHLGLHTGLRPGDLYTLTWQELNVTFAKLKKVTGKSARSVRKGKGGTLVEMKLNQRIQSIMKAWWEFNDSPQTGLVFRSPITGAQLTLTAHQRPWKTVKKMGGLPEELNFYALRHHFISSLVTQNMPLLAVASLAGHKSIAMIELHYGHLCKDQAAEAVDIIAGEIEKALAEGETERSSNKS
ncbi:tyrosine-type recombinase/integrase, partial [bacterium]|nr:tyrosine-type recombinase/integrase [bacterium]